MNISDLASNEYRHYLGARMRFLRKKLGETQTQFALRLGVTKLSVVNYETGATCPSAEQLHNLHLTGVDASFIAFGSPSLSNPEALKGFAKVHAIVRRECKLASLKLSEEELLATSWHMFFRLTAMSFDQRDGKSREPDSISQFVAAQLHECK